MRSTFYPTRCLVGAFPAPISRLALNTGGVMLRRVQGGRNGEKECRSSPAGSVLRCAHEGGRLSRCRAEGGSAQKAVGQQKVHRDPATAEEISRSVGVTKEGCGDRRQDSAQTRLPAANRSREEKEGRKLGQGQRNAKQELTFSLLLASCGLRPSDDGISQRTFRREIPIFFHRSACVPDSSGLQASLRSGSSK